MILTKEQILNANDLKQKTIEVPEWGGSVIIKTLTGNERDQFEEAIYKAQEKKTLKDIRATLLSFAIIDEDGNRLFNQKSLTELGNKSSKVIDRIYEAVAKLSGISDKDIEEIEKNSEAVL